MLETKRKQTAEKMLLLTDALVAVSGLSSKDPVRALAAFRRAMREEL